MKKNIYVLAAMLIGVLLLGACNDYETYGEQKEKERDAIAQFIKDSAITVISETVFEQQNNTTDLSRNEFVRLNKSGVYMQIVRKGDGTPLEDGKSINLLCRFVEINIKQNTVYYNAYNYVFQEDKLNVQRSGSTYTASFVAGRMLEAYGASVPAGWLVAFNYLIGNADAHAKNHSVVYRGGAPVFAPLYDLVCTAVYPELSRESAMRIGGDAAFERISRDSFARMGEACRISPRLALDRLDALAAKILPAARTLAEACADSHPSPVYSRIVDVIAAQTARVAKP